MAGAGYKLFNTGDVLTAAQVNTYLQEQTVMVFADSTARTTALSGVLSEGMMSYLQDTNAVEVYNGSAWVSVGSTGDITGVTAGTGLSGGGTSGTVTITNDMATTITAAGDIVVGTGSGTYDNLPIGTTGQVLTADTTVSPYKVKWAAAGSSGALTLTGSASPSASSNFTITNCFSATYRNYLVVFDGSETADTLIRFGTSGTANTTSNYTYRGYYNISSITALNTNQATSFKMLDHGSVTIGGTIRIQSPYETKRTCYQWDLIGVNGSTTALDANLAGFFDATTSFTDLNFSSSGTFTGNVYVYGLANS